MDISFIDKDSIPKSRAFSKNPEYDNVFSKMPQAGRAMKITIGDKNARDRFRGGLSMRAIACKKKGRNVLLALRGESIYIWEEIKNDGQEG
jgi:hypothetical protein